MCKTFKADFHLFTYDENPAANPVTAAADGISQAGGVRDKDIDIGYEQDLTLVHAYNANTKISLGWSVFNTEISFQDDRGFTDNSANWGYVMFDVKF